MGVVVKSHNKEAWIGIKNIRCFLIGVEYSFKGWDTPSVDVEITRFILFKGLALPLFLRRE